MKRLKVLIALAAAFVVFFLVGLWLNSAFFAYGLYLLIIIAIYYIVQFFISLGEQ